MPACCPTEITKDETDIYDRQIRLWGLDAQNRLRNSSVLLVGLSGLGAEVAKNLMLCGLKSLTLLDDKKLSNDDEYAQFLTTPSDVGKNRAEVSKERTRVLNPLVELNVVTDNVAEKPDEYFQQFDLVVLIDQKYSVVDRVNKICRKANIRFQAGGVFGWLGYGFSDFNGQTFLVPKQKEQTMVEFAESELPGEPSPKKAKTIDEAVTIEDEADQQVKVQVPFPSFEEALNVNWGAKKYLRKVKRVVPPSYYPLRALLKITDKQDDFDEGAFLAAWKEELEKAFMKEQAESLDAGDAIYYMDPQLSPVCAVVGGIIGQEAIKALSQKDAPLKNLFVYSAMDTTGIVCDFPPSS